MYCIISPFAYFILYILHANRKASMLSEYEVCSLSNEYSDFVYAVLSEIINLSNCSGIAKYSLFISMCKWANICLCSVANDTGRTRIVSGLGPSLLVSHFRDSLNATFSRFVAASIRPVHPKK